MISRAAAVQALGRAVERGGRLGGIEETEREIRKILIQERYGVDPSTLTAAATTEAQRRLAAISAPPPIPTGAVTPEILARHAEMLQAREEAIAAAKAELPVSQGGTGTAPGEGEIDYEDLTLWERLWPDWEPFYARPLFWLGTLLAVGGGVVVWKVRKKRKKGKGK